MTNWAGNVAFGAAEVRRPATVAQVRELVTSRRHVRVLGAGHSFSSLADTDGLQLSMAGLPPLVEIDTARRRARVAAGLRYGDIVEPLDAAGLALPNLASLPHLSVAGAVATGTHGSGPGNQNLAAAVSGLELVTGDGDLVELRRGGPGFDGAVVSLGCVGAVVFVTLDLVPSFVVRQVVYEQVPRAAVVADLAGVLGRAYSVSVFTRWDAAAADQVWVKARVGSDVADAEAFPAQWLGGRLADRPVHMIAGAPAERCTEQLGVPGPWYDRLPHFRLDHTPSSGDELQTEYLLPVARGVEAVEAVEAMARAGPLLSSVLQVSEIRTVAADELWLSPAYRQDSLALHFTWVRDVARVLPAVRAVEAALLPLGARPHWGKVYAADPAAVAARYERLPDFVALAQSLDPAGRFRNDSLFETYG